MMYMHEVFAFHLKSSPFWSRIARMHEFCKFLVRKAVWLCSMPLPVACGLVGTAHTGRSTLFPFHHASWIVGVATKGIAEGPASASEVATNKPAGFAKSKKK